MTYTPKSSGQFFAGHCPESGPIKQTCCQEDLAKYGEPKFRGFALTFNTPDKKIWECPSCMCEYFWIKEK